MAMFFFSSLSFDALCITHVILPFYALPTKFLLPTVQGLGLFLMHFVLVDLIQTCTYTMSSI